MSHAAGILLVRHDGAILLVRRSRQVSTPSVWSIPGGQLHPGENPVMGARREFIEEMGELPPGRIVETFEMPIHRGTYLTLVVQSRGTLREWQPRLNWEHDAWGWFWVSALPYPLHPGVEAVLFSE